MAHFLHVRPSGVWTTLYVPNASDFTTIDQQLYQAVNGDGGGTWSPSAAIVLGGAGLTIAAGATCHVQGTLSIDSSPLGTLTIAGNAEVTSVGGVQFDSGALLSCYNNCYWHSGAAIVVQNGATASFGTGAVSCVGTPITLSSNATISLTGSSSIVSSLAGAIGINGNGLVIQDSTNPTIATPRARTIAQPLIVTAGGTGATLVQGSQFTDVATGTFFVPLTKLINGSTMASVAVGCSIASPHSPASAASVTVVRCHNANGSTSALGVSAAPTGVSGQQTISITVGAVIDDSQYSYYLAINAETGAGAQNLTWYPPLVSMTNITTLGQF